MKSPRILAGLWIAAAALALDHSVANADWPQWRGPNRDGVSLEKGLLKSWPKEGPARLWLFEQCGLGYSGPAIVGNRLYTMGAREGGEQLLAIDVADGAEAWSAPIGETLGNNWGDGPRGAPTVDGEFIYALGAKGDLVCVALQTGDVVWKKSLIDLGGQIPTWGYSESPLVYEDKVICTPGGEQGAIVAFDKKTGDVIWQTADVTSGAHYASCVVAQRPDGAECVQLLPDQLVGLDVATGKVRWSEPWPMPTAAIPTPIVRDEFVFATSGYGVGCKLVKVESPQQAELVYENKTMKNKHGGVVLVGEHLYGHSERMGWVCQEFKTGESVWRERDALEMGSVAYADGMLYCVGEDEGDVVLVEASPEGWKEHGRFRLDPQSDQRKPAGRIWTHPAICDGRLYLRDQNLLYCYDIRDPAASAGAAGK